MHLKTSNKPKDEPPSTRRSFLQLTTAVGMGIIFPAGLRVVRAAENKGKEEERVASAEDLMREHGVLNRVLLIYEEVLRRLASSKPDLKPEVLSDPAGIIRHFIEDYHEKLEENYLFSRFEKAGKYIDLVNVLRQ
ncbi:MAG: hemerythrin domain-containing protein [Ignavibacteriales bacterium]